MKKTIFMLGAVVAWVCGVFGATHEGVQLWENGPLWAKTNIGATSPTETGYYFWWGDTLGYKWQNSQWVASDNSVSGYSFSSTTSGKTIAQLQAMGAVGDDGVPVGGTIGGGTGSVRKVDVQIPQVPSAEYTGEAVAPLVPTSALYAVSASSWTRPGTYPVMLTLLDAANYKWVVREGATVNGALAVVNFVIVEPPPAIVVEDGGQSGSVAVTIK